MLRIGEYIRFQALAEVNDGDKDKSVVRRFIDLIKVDHRIADLPSIEHIKFEAPNRSRIRRSFMGVLVMLGSFLIISGAILFGSAKETLAYRYITDDGPKEVRMLNPGRYKVTIRGIDQDFKRRILRSEFVENIEEVVGVTPIAPQLYFAAPFLLILIAWLVFYIQEIFAFRLAQKLSRLMMTHADDDSSYTDQTSANNKENTQSKKSLE
jgi:hypothetical protein